MIQTTNQWVFWSFGALDYLYNGRYDKLLGCNYYSDQVADTKIKSSNYKNQIQ